jgi:PAS domain S-box-containing protein
MLGSHVFDMFTDEGVATVKAILHNKMEPAETSAREGYRTFSVQHHCKDGRLLWGVVLAKPERDAQGTITGYHGTTRERTERMRLEGEGADWPL